MEKLISSILEQLTLDEKIFLTHGSSCMGVGPIERLGIQELLMADGPQGIRLEDGRTTTALPCGMALAASFDEKQAEKYGTVIAREALANGIQVSLGPAFNMMRTPMNGRNFEYYGEDPVLAGKIASGYIRGCQSEKVAATPKHLALNNQEICRCISSSNCDERTLRELYLRAFEIVVQVSAQPAPSGFESDSVVCSSTNRNNGRTAWDAKDEIILGEAVPGGRLPFSWAEKLEDYPCHANGSYPGDRSDASAHTDYLEGMYIGYRHFDRSGVKPVFPFGFGLGYGKPVKMRLKECRKTQDCGAEIAIELSNPNNTEMTAVPQLYIGDEKCSLDRPVKELAAFASVTLQANEEREIVLQVGRRCFSFYDPKQRKFCLEPGEFKLYLGTNAQNIVDSTTIVQSRR